MKVLKNLRSKAKNLINEKWLKKYHVFIAILSFIAIAITIFSLSKENGLLNYPMLYGIDTIIIIIFNIDYWGGLSLSEDKKKYFKENIFDLISIIPINQGLMLFRGFKLIKLIKVINLFKFVQIVRITSFLAILNNSMKKFLRINGFIYALIFTICTIGIGSTFIYILEKGKTIETYFDALWWTFVTTTTVGYGDISPQSGGGRIVAVILMIVGIGFISMLTGSITTYFVDKINEEKKDYQTDVILDKIISDINGEDIDLSDLTDEQYAQVILFIKFLKGQNTN